MLGSFSRGWEGHLVCPLMEYPARLADGLALSCLYGWNHVMPPVPMLVAYVAVGMEACLCIGGLLLVLRIWRWARDS